MTKKDSKKAIFVSVRTGSKRLPNKCLLPLNGQTTIEYLIKQVKKSKLAEEIILCTTNKVEDDVLCEIAQRNNIKFFRGSEEDKLKRWYDASIKHNIKFFVNVDGDDLFFDPELIDYCFLEYQKTNADFIDGKGLYIDAYGIKASALKICCEEKTETNTELISKYFYNIDKKIKIKKLKDVPVKWLKKKMRMTLDYSEDYVFFKEVINQLNILGQEFNFENILKFLKTNPEVCKINYYRDQHWKDNQIKKR